MDDFYAECDEHLTEIRHGLLQLEQQGQSAPADPDVIERVFRSLHSVKGICGMAGLASAERVAHAAEDYLRALMRHEVSLTPAGLDLLNDVAQKLEELALRHREGKPDLDVQPLIEQAATLLPAQRSTGPAESGSPKTTPPQAVPPPNKQLLRCVFRPSPELDQRGVNVSSVRMRLQEVGEILSATPRVQPGGELLFEFLVSSTNPPPTLQAYEADGIQMTRVAETASQDTHKPPLAATMPAPGGTSPFVAPSHFVRVDLGRLDDLMRVMGEIVVQQARLEEGLNRITAGLPAAESAHLQEIRHGLNRELRYLRDGLMRLRLVPIGEIFDRLPFVVRDLSRETGKKVRLVVEGQQTELDKYLVERMKDPLLHLVRNAVCHGIEAPPDRLAGGKPAEGTITLRADTVAETVLIEVSDDGRGIDRTKVRATAITQGLEVPPGSDSDELLQVLCTPGFSTRDTADLGSGRGMGMAAVKDTVEELSGEMELHSEPNRGSTFQLRLPLTLAVTDALILLAGGQRFAMPQSLVQEITTTDAAAIHLLEHNEIMRHRDSVLPLVRLSSVFGLPTQPLQASPVLVIGAGTSTVGIVADRVLGHREILVRPMRDPLLQVPGISGATELGDGRAVLILDSGALALRAKSRQKRLKIRTDHFVA